MKIRLISIILVCLNALAVYSQPRSRQDKDQVPTLYRITENDKRSGRRRFGFIDHTGKVIIDFDRLPKKTIEVGDFHEGRAVIYLGKTEEDVFRRGMKYDVGYIDTSGKTVITPRFSFASDFSEGLAHVTANDFDGFIDLRGRRVIKLANKSARDFHEGLAAITIAEGREYGFIDRTGKVVIQGRYRFVDDFSEGLAGVVIDYKYGFINRAGELVVPPRFGMMVGPRHPNLPVSSGRFREGLACVNLGNSWGYINSQGEFVIPPQFAEAQEFSEGVAWVMPKDSSRSGWIDKTGQWVNTNLNKHRESPETAWASESEYRYRNMRFSEGLVSFVRYDGNKILRGYMDRDGKVIIPAREWSVAGVFQGGVARMEFYEKTDADLQQVNGYRDGAGQVWEQKYGYIDRTGKIIWRSK
jgi:hypothetical protein